MLSKLLREEKGFAHIFGLLVLTFGLFFLVYFFRSDFKFFTPAEAVSSPPTFRASSVNGTGATKATSISVNTPTGIVNDDIMIAQITTFTTSANITAPSGWTFIRKDTFGTNGGQLASSLYWKKATNEPTSYTWNFSVLTYAGAAILGYYNAGDLVEPYTSNYGGQNSTQVTSQQVTTATDNEMLIYFGVINGTGVISTPASMTQRIGGTTGPQIADQIIATAGPTGPRTGMASASGNNIGQLLAIKPLPEPSPTQTPSPTPIIVFSPPEPEITFRDKSTQLIGNTTSLNISKPAALQANDLQVAQVVTFGNPKAVITPPTGWTLIRRDLNGNHSSNLYWKKATQSEPGSYSWTFSSSTVTGGAIIAYANAASPVGSPPYDSNFKVQNSTQVTSLGVNTYVQNQLLIYFGMIAASTSITPPNGMTERYTGNFIAADETSFYITPLTGTGDKIGTAGATGANIGQLITLIPEKPSLPLDTGAVSVSSTSSCGSDCTEHSLDIYCQYIPTRHMKVREYNNTSSPLRGTVIYGTGQDGTLFYSDLDTSTLDEWNDTPNNVYDNPKQTRIQLQAAGFKGYEIAWTDSLGWRTNTDYGFGIKKAMCGYAAAVKWIRDREVANSDVFCAQGNSAAGTQIAFGLSYYGLDSILDMAIITGGPVFARTETGYDTGSCNASAASTWTDYPMGWFNNGDYAKNSCTNQTPMTTSPLSAVTAQGAASPNFPGDYSFPNTKLNFIGSETDVFQTHGMSYINLIPDGNLKNLTYTTVFPNNPTNYSHLVDQYNQGAGIIRNLIQSECHSW